MLIHSYINKDKGMGLGDFIRGSLGAKQLCVDYGIPFEIDFRHHPIGKYLQPIHNQPIIPIDKIIDLQDAPNFTVRSLKTNIEKYTSLKALRNTNLGIYTNIWPTFKIQTRISSPIQKYFQPTLECEMAIRSALGNLKNYRVVHIRTGDLLAFKTQIGDTVDYTLDDIIQNLSAIQKIKSSSNAPCIVISDSLECKQIVSKYWEINYPKTIPRHMALEQEAVLDTLVDFFIMSRAREIHQFSVHHWGSGFSDSVGWLYRVPVIKHKLF